MNIQLWTYFAAVAREGNLTQAASKLFISQQALSRAIQSLEGDLNNKLFFRSEYGMVLTPIGKKILPVVEAMLEKISDYDAIIQKLIQQREPTLSIGLQHQFLNYLIPPDFLSKMVGIDISIQVIGNFQKCLDRIITREKDLAIVHHEASYPEEIEFIPIVSEPPYILMSKDHFLARKKQLSISDLNGIPHIMPEASPKIIQQYIRCCIDSGFYPNIILSSPEMEVLLNAASQNLGVVPSTSFGINKQHENRIVSRPLICEGLLTEFGFIRRRDTESPAITSFVNAICSQYR